VTRILGHLFSVRVIPLQRSFGVVVSPVMIADLNDGHEFLCKSVVLEDVACRIPGGWLRVCQLSGSRHTFSIQCLPIEGGVKKADPSLASLHWLS